MTDNLESLLNVLLSASDSTKHNEVMQQIKVMGQAVVPQLIGLLGTPENHEYWEDRTFLLIDLLGAIGGSDAVEALYDQLLRYPLEQTYEEHTLLGDEAAEALMALKALNESRLIPFLKSIDPVVRGNAAWYLQWCRNSENQSLIVDALIPLADDPSEVVRNAVVFTLGACKDSRATAAVTSILRRATKPNYRINALDALPAVSDHRAVEIVLSLLEDKDEWVRAAARTLQKLRK